jgi:hypothetical protein
MFLKLELFPSSDEKKETLFLVAQKDPTSIILIPEDGQSPPTQ